MKENVESQILLVEDNPEHAELIMATLEGHEMTKHIKHIEDGRDALDYLYNCAIDSAEGIKSFPELILLDLRLPRIDGLTILEDIKNNMHLRNIPVVVLTTSQADQDISKAYEFHVNSYLIKPFDFQRFTQMLLDIGKYWLLWNKRTY